MLVKRITHVVNNSITRKKLISPPWVNAGYCKLSINFCQVFISSSADIGNTAWTEIVCWEMQCLLYDINKLGAKSILSKQINKDKSREMSLLV